MSTNYQRPEDNQGVNDVSRISAGSTVKGEISSPYNVRIDGNFEGRIVSQSKVVIGEKAIIKGDIICNNIDIWGNVQGDLYVQDTLALKETCVVEGDLHIRRLAVELDATFNGNCKMITEEEFAQLTSGEQPAMYSVEEEKPVQEDEEEVDECLTPESIAKIEKLLAEWCKNGGFRDSAMNMPMLASMICVNRKDLSAYFEDYLQSSFRVWLSDIRFQKAQSMLREETRYSNETVSIECGFSSHAHLYKVFKAKTGMTPIQWRRFMAKKASENSFIPTNETPI